VRLAPTATFAPAFDNAKAVTYPMPLLAPVTMATLSFIMIQFGSDHCFMFLQKLYGLLDNKTKCYHAEGQLRVLWRRDGTAV
jgi:hypothetical protein